MRAIEFFLWGFKMNKKVTLIVTKAPYGTAIMAEAFRVAMGLPTTNIDTNVVLKDDGIFALLKSSKPKENLDFGNLGEAFMMFDDFDFKLYVHKTSLETRGIKTDDLMYSEYISDDEFDNMIRESDAILRF